MCFFHLLINFYFGEKHLKSKATKLEKIILPKKKLKGKPRKAKR